MGNNSSASSAATIQGVDEFDGGNTLAVAGGRNRTLRKRTRRGGQMYKALFGGRKRTRRGGQILVETQ
jgi:hypothetical protein